MLKGSQERTGRVLGPDEGPKVDRDATEGSSCSKTITEIHLQLVQLNVLISGLHR